jgi:S-adenosylmethionine-diacylglycerol 3-amino-3-carboxypropyl transferase
MAIPTLRDKLDQKIFDAITSRSLVYNTCWEDPAVDRRALALGGEDTVLVITSAGCNALDYALQAPRRIFAVDANPRQNALLQLKLAGIRRLAYDDFFALFGEGHHPRFAELYRDALRADLPDFARAWWDERGHWFTSRCTGFYFRGLSGLVARCVRAYFVARPRLGDAVAELLDARDLIQQRAIYDRRVAPQLWNGPVNWVIARQSVMSLLGVPTAQRHLVEAQHEGGVSGYIRSAIQYVCRQLPLADNYFWHVYLTGRYREHVRALVDLVVRGVLGGAEPTRWRAMRPVPVNVFEGLKETEVGDLHPGYTGARIGDEHVVGLQRAMHHPARVRVIERRQ